MYFSHIHCILLFQLFQSFLNHTFDIIIGMIVLLQAQQILACIQFLIHSDIYIGQKDEAACQPVGMRGALVDEVQYFLFGCGIPPALYINCADRYLASAPYNVRVSFARSFRSSAAFFTAFWFR